MKKIFSIILISFLFVACKKDLSSVPTSVQIPSSVSETAFFRISDTVPAVVKKLAQRIEKQNKKYRFIENFIRKEGYAVWNKVNIYTTKTDRTIFRNTNTASSDTILFVPLVLPNTTYVNSFLACRVDGDTVAIKLHRGRAYKSYGTDPHPDSISAKKLALEIMSLNKDVFSNDVFQVSDSTLFEKTHSKATKWVRIKEEMPMANRVIIFNTVRCYQTGNDGDQGQVVGLESGQNNNYSTSGYNCYAQVVMVFLPDYSDGGGLGVSLDPNNGGGGGSYGMDPTLYWWDDTPCPTPPDPNSPQEVVIGEPTPCNGVIGWQPLHPFFNATVQSNGFQNPCIVAAKNKLPDFDLNLFSKNLLRTPYANTFNWKIVFEENAALMKRDKQGALILDQNGNPIPKPAHSFPVDADKEWHIQINPKFFNGNLLSNSSQEYAGLLILHEIIHGYLDIYMNYYNIVSFETLDQHTIMLKNFVSSMKTTLMRSFNLSEVHATALAIQGMDDVLKTKVENNIVNQWDQEMGQFVFNNYNITISGAYNIFYDYFTGVNGTKCL